MGKRLGNLIREARNNAGYTQEQLARKIRGVSQSEIGRWERGEAEPTTQNVKDIAVICGVTQKSLLEAMPKSSSSRSTSSSTAVKSSMQVTATERRLVELYRQASSDDKKKAMSVLRGNHVDAEDIIEDVIGGIGDMLFKK